MKILDFLRSESIIASLQARSKDAALAELLEPIAKANPHVDKELLLKTLIERESIGSTGIGGGIAIPHGKYDGLDRLSASFGKSDEGVDFSSMDNKPAHLFFLLVAPRDSASDHLKALARISRLFKDPFLKDLLLQAVTAEEIYRLLEEYDLQLP